MNRLKLVEIVVLAGTALLTAVRSIVKFFEYIGKLRERRAACAA